MAVCITAARSHLLPTDLIATFDATWHVENAETFAGAASCGVDAGSVISDAVFPVAHIPARLYAAVDGSVLGADPHGVSGKHTFRRAQGSIGIRGAQLGDP